MRGLLGREAVLEEGLNEDVLVIEEQHGGGGRRRDAAMEWEMLSR